MVLCPSYKQGLGFLLIGLILVKAVPDGDVFINFLIWHWQVFRKGQTNLGRCSILIGL